MASFSKKLCRAVEQRRLLYDRTLQQRVRRVDIDMAWEAVAAECNENTHSVKTRWRNIRKVLLRFVTKNQTAQTRKTRSRDYYLYDELQFLLPHLNNFEPDDLADSDSELGTYTSSSTPQKETTPVSLKEQTDESNEGTIVASENGATPAIVAGEKRKRESKSGQASPTKSLNAAAAAVAATTAVGSKSNDDKQNISKQSDGNYVVSESPADGSSSLRIRRVNISNAKVTPKNKVQLQDQEEQHTPDATDPLQLKPEGRKREAASMQLRERSKSLYLERPIYASNSDSDAEYNPPPRKKTATVKESTPPVPSKMVTRKKAATKVKIMEPNVTKNIESPTPNVPDLAPTLAAAEVVVEAQPPSIVTPPEQSTSTLSTETDNEDFAGIDMTLLAAAAEAEAAAAAEESNALCPVVGADAAIQCDIFTDEEDDEFLQRMRKWQQTMTQRQKIIFRRGIYQAYMDVYDDTREFVEQKGTEKFAMSQGVPAIFSGMSPVELRLVRHLAMAVTGHKSATSLYANVDNKPQLQPTRTVAGVNNGNSHSNYHNSNDINLKQAMQMSRSRTPPEKVMGNANSGIVRTTAIALTNHNMRTGASVPRILRKVVRVGNNGSPNNTALASSSTNSGSANASNAVQSPNTLAQRNPSLLRPRMFAGNVSVNGAGTPVGDKQRVYRILANGVVARQNTGGGTASNSSPNNTNSPTSFSGAFALLNNSFNSPLPTTEKNVTQFRQIMPKHPTTSTAASLASASGTTTMTATTTQTANGEPKLPGISVRRNLATAPDGRSQISRRYSVCGSAIASNELHAAQQKAEYSTATRRSVASMQALPTRNNTDPAKGTVRVRYAQNPTANMRAGNLQPVFAVPTPVTNQSAQANKSPNNIMSGPLAGVPLNEPIPVAMSTTWHSTQKQPDQKPMKLQPGNQDSIASDAQPKPIDDNPLSTATKQNCIIPPDTFESFVIKNEPLDLEDED